MKSTSYYPKASLPASEGILATNVSLINRSSIRLDVGLSSRTGDAEGTFVGEEDGMVLGDTVGDLEGTSDGKEDGVVLGDTVGGCVG